MKDRVLIADDDSDVLSALDYLLETENYEVCTAASPHEVIHLLKKSNFNLLLMDLNYSKDTTSGQEGLELVNQIRKFDEQLAIVVMTAWGSIETAVEAIKQGARDFVQKPWDNDRLLSVIANQILLQKSEQQSLKLEQENQLLRDQIGSEKGLLVSRSKIMGSLMAQLRQVGRSDASILLTGENGTGKSFLVQHLHDISPRKSQSLISVNMGSISESLFESEMFGHVKGAFTDARENRIGRFELADGGTLFLDEIGNTPYSQQAKLLRVLENHQFEKVGSSRTQASDCRLICATNSDLPSAVDTGLFRKDLFYRINTVTIEVPSLRQRVEDIVPLAEFFLQSQIHKYKKPGLIFSEESKLALEEYGWPGNIRELAHVVERATILNSSREIRSVELGISNRSSRSENGEDKASEAECKSANNTLDEIEKAIFVDRIDQFSGNNLDAAKSLGLSKSAFYRHLRKHDL